MIPSAQRGGRYRLSKRQGRGKRGVCTDPSDDDAGQKIKGKKRHILVDTVGLLLHAVVHPAYIQDRPRVPALGVNSTDAQKGMFQNINFADGL